MPLVHQSLDDCHQLSDLSRRLLRSDSNDIRMLFVPRTHNRFGDRSFTAAGPRLWNDLPPELRRPDRTFAGAQRSDFLYFMRFTSTLYVRVYVLCILMCAQKLTNSQLSVPHKTDKQKEY